MGTMMDEPVKKKVDESWKEQAEREKQVAGQRPAAAAPRSAGAPQTQASAPASAEGGAGAGEGAAEARFDLFISGLAMEGFVAMGELPHPATRKRAINLVQAKYLIDLLGVLEEKTKGNLSADEERLLRDALYQLRMRYLNKGGG